MAKILTSLLLVEERLLEADHFARSIAVRRDTLAVGYELNAFVSAARSVTFLLQKEMARVPGFLDWWVSRRTLLSADPSAEFFLQLRNFSQKEGKISLVGASVGSGSKKRWSYRFAGNEARVPGSLFNRDVSECCREHVAKLAAVVVDCTDRFPYHSCPRRALSVDGLRVVGVSIEDVEAALGLPRGWTECVPPNVVGQLRVLSEMVDGVDFDAIQALAAWAPPARDETRNGEKSLSEDLLDVMVDRLERRGENINALGLAVELILRPEGGSRDSS